MNSTNSELDKTNVMLVKNYIDKHYVIYRIHADRYNEKRFPLSHDFSIKEKESDYKVDLWHVESDICKIFGVERTIIIHAIKELIFEEINKKLETQIKLKF